MTPSVHRSRRHALPAKVRDSKLAMKAQKNGTFKGSITVPEGEQGTYQYRFKYTFADNSVKYDNDWDAERYVANPFGGDNSVFSAVRD